jgi:peptidyl-prolyl cis-trans isomerase C
MKEFPMKKLLASAAIVALSALPLPQAGDAMEVDADTVLATVNGNDITVGHLVAMRAMLPAQYQELPPQILFDGMLEQLVQQQVLADVAAEDMTERDGTGPRERAPRVPCRQLVEGVAMPRSPMRSCRPSTTRNTPPPNPVEEFNASHILVETEEEAQGLIDALAEGADFAELAAENSIGPSGPNGGQLGWFTAGMMVPEFETPCSSWRPARFPSRCRRSSAGT